jgi:uncharacterized protein DUF5522
VNEERLVEGEDYTVEGGLFIFTRKYLLRRGYCCQSGCRNCPYGDHEGTDAHEPPAEPTAPAEEV